MKNNWYDKKIMKMVREKIIDKLEVAGEFIEGQAKLNISGHNGMNLKAVDTGNLMNSITHEVDKKELSVKIGTNVEYAPYVEFGTGEYAENGEGRKGGWFYTNDKGKTYFTLGMKPRPFLRTAFYENKDEIKKIMNL